MKLITMLVNSNWYQILLGEYYVYVNKYQVKPSKKLELVESGY